MANNIPAWLKELVYKTGYHNQEQYFELSKNKSARYAVIRNGNIRNVSRPFVVVLEGIPGVGKTTLTEYLSKKLDYNQVGQIIITGDDSKEEFFLRNDEVKCKKSLKGNKSITIADRNYVSTLAYNYAADELGFRNARNTVEQWYAKNWRKKLFIPDLYVYMEVSIDNSFKRKGRTPYGEKSIWYDPKALELMNKYYKDYFSISGNFYNLLKIDTNKYSAKQVADRIVREVKKLM